MWEKLRKRPNIKNGKNGKKNKLYSRIRHHKKLIRTDHIILDGHQGRYDPF